MTFNKAIHLGTSWTSGGSPQTVYDQITGLTGTDDGGGDTGNTFRVLIPTSALTSPTGSPTQFRVTFLWGDSSSSDTGALLSMYAGQQAAAGDSYDFQNSPAQVTFTGSGTDSTPGGSLVSDWVNLPETFDASKVFVVSFSLNSGNSVHLSQLVVGTSASYFKAGNDASTQNATGYSFIGGSPIFSIAKIEVQ